MRGEGEQEEADELEEGGESRRSLYIVSTVPLWMGLSYFVSLVPSTQYPHPVGVDVIYIYIFFFIKFQTSWCSHGAPLFIVYFLYEIPTLSLLILTVG